FETWREWYYPVVEVMPKQPISVEDTGGIARYIQREQASRHMRSSLILRGRSRSRRSPGTCGSQTPGALGAPSSGSSGAAPGTCGLRTAPGWCHLPARGLAPLVRGEFGDLLRGF